MAKVDISFKGTTCIYKITSPSGKIYIGQTWDLYHRYKSGVSKRQRLLYRSYRKYGEEKHILEVLHIFKNANQQELDYWENFYINQYISLGIVLLNIRSGGSKGRHSEETKRILGKRKIEWSKNNPGLGKKYLKKAIESNIGRKHSDESKKKRSEKLLGRNKSQQHCENISKAKQGKSHKPQNFTKQGLSNIREAAKNRTANNKSIVQMNLQGDEIRKWPSIKIASETLKIHKGTIGGCLRGYKSYYTAGGFKWKYADKNKTDQ